MGHNEGVALTREKIVDTALRVLGKFGLADLSMRRLASELGVAPGALYYHVKNKQELLALLAVRLLGMVERPDASAGLSGLVDSSVSLYRTLIPMRESAEVVRLGMAARRDPFLAQHIRYIDEIEYIFSGVGGCSQPAVAAETLLHVCLSFMEQEQTAALLAGAAPSPTPPPSYLLAVEAVAAGFCPGRA